MKNKNCAVLDVADHALTAVEEMGGDTSDLRRELAFARADRCVCCGAVVLCTLLYHEDLIERW